MKALDDRGDAAQLTVTVVVQAPILAGMGARTALATTTPRTSVERQTAAIENLMRRMGCSLGLTQHRLDGQQHGGSGVPVSGMCLWITPGERTAAGKAPARPANVEPEA